MKSWSLARGGTVGFTGPVFVALAARVNEVLSAAEAVVVDAGPPI
jgi:hypothetical protein